MKRRACRAGSLQSCSATALNEEYYGMCGIAHNLPVRYFGLSIQLHICRLPLRREREVYS